MSIAVRYIYFCWLFANSITNSYILNMMTIREFSEVLKEIRGNTAQGEMARILGITQAYYSELERGKKNPSMAMLRSFSEKINKPLSYLMGETEDPTPADQSAKKEQPAIKSNVHLEIEEPISIDQIVIPVLSPEQTACCGNGIPLSEITSGNDEKILVPRKEVGMLCDGKMPFAIIADGESMKKWGIRSGSRVVINPVEELHDFDIALVCYKDNLVLKKLRRMRDGSIDLISADGSIITVPADDVCVPDLFAIWGKAMTYTYKESGKVKHGL